MRAVILRGLAVWLVIIVAESVHGTLRELFLRPVVGDLRARQIALLTGMFIIFAVAYAFVRWIRANSVGQLLLIGALWVLLTLIFEFSLGLFVLGYSWERLLSDYDITRGGYLALGMGVLFLAPLAAAKMRKTMTRPESKTS